METPDKIWRKDGFTLRLWYAGTGEYGKARLRYEFKDGRRVIFTGADYQCSPMHAYDSLDSVYGLLGFLALQDGDTDAEYFDDYTPEQLAWAASNRAGHLGLLVYDREIRRKEKRSRK